MIIVQKVEQCPTATTLTPKKKMEVSEVHRRVVNELDFDMPRRDIPPLAHKDVDTGSLLGTGSFSEVFSVRVLLDDFNEEGLLDATAEDSSSEADLGTPVGNLPKHSYRTLTSISSHITASGPKYAIKSIRRDFAGDQIMTALAVRDAYYEAEILSHLPPHPNVVNLLGAHVDFWKDPTQGFLILERVEETLKHRLVRWRRAATNAKTAPFFRFTKRHRDRLHQQRSRIESCGVGIARALKFLHRHGIVYRDLKPANVGFGYDGNVKLFDFGLARRHVPVKGRPRRLTGNAGTARYMAPEVSLHEDYSLPADIHSYGILLWELCTLEKPYGNYSSLDQLKEKAVESNHRPSLRKIASPQLRNLLNTCWDPDPRARPTFVLVLKEVETIAGVSQPL